LHHNTKSTLPIDSKESIIIIKTRTISSRILYSQTKQSQYGLLQNPPTLHTTTILCCFPPKSIYQKLVMHCFFFTCNPCYKPHMFLLWQVTDWQLQTKSIRKSIAIYCLHIILRHNNCLTFLSIDQVDTKNKPAQ
jgi:hypothetical protein